MIVKVKKRTSDEWQATAIRLTSACFQKLGTGISEQTLREKWRLIRKDLDVLSASRLSFLFDEAIRSACFGEEQVPVSELVAAMREQEDVAQTTLAVLWESELEKSKKLRIKKLSAWIAQHWDSGWERTFISRKVLDEICVNS